MFSSQKTANDIEDLQSDEIETELMENNKLDVLSDFDMQEEEQEYANIQKQFNAAVAEFEEKSQTLEKVAVKLESIEKEQEIIDGWKKEIKDRIEQGEDIDHEIKVISFSFTNI